MKLNIAYPATGLQKTVEIDDDKKLLPFFDKRMGAEVSGDTLGDEFKGYVFKVSGGNDKQGFPMMQGVLSNQRVRLLFHKGMKCYRQRRTGEFKRKSVRGCVVGPDLAVLDLVVLKKGAEEVPGLTDGNKPRRLGPKRASGIRKLFNLQKDDDVTKFVIGREFERKGKQVTRRPRIQRLITSTRLQHKRRVESLKKKHFAAGKEAAKNYAQMCEDFHKQQKEARASELAKKKKELAKKKAAKEAAAAPKAAPAPKAAAPKTAAKSAPKKK
eukprot:GDKI01023086.1.p1 GENE.GDKI01023086.1~~GDKI01023086.1.p1  ORF type:complete len:289 (-),score=124.30 GDKI01023086.1:146-955(-)